MAKKVKNELSKFKLLTISGLIFSGLGSVAVAAENQSGGVSLGASRVIYPVGARSVNLSVNNTADNPFLVKSEVLDETMQHEAPFVITPPLFRLDGGQRNTLSITRTGGNFLADRESVNWVCVNSIAPEPDSEGDGSKKENRNDNISVMSRLLPGICIKLFVRPESLQGNSLDVANKVTWKIKGNTVAASNPTPFYINISEASVSRKKLKMDKTYIPPFSEEKYPLPSGVVKNNTVIWKIVGDYGEDKEEETVLN
ncbi:molecular chaperone [Salmonella enterica]|uniref:fimbrial biogenesis chaperone n=1 Tax=Salmonella enterica TaxID=28901 RepID=UPI000F9C3945|nr:molecular chaperone [Salmonella enterica subsp. diarizonae]EJM5006041.1 molecular chaperone [Salmonella enterica]EKK6346102.1 molecular chaperone [Salmonella enterica]ELO7821145.1 molecular chaperone [Salmonella enterica]ELR6877930.1 molecular chaperone [Salmonella enterica]